MIQVTRLNHTVLVLNSDLIEHLETTPDTVISMTTGQKFMVRESAEEVIRRVVAFRREICADLPMCPSALPRAGSRAPGEVPGTVEAREE